MHNLASLGLDSLRPRPTLSPARLISIASLVILAACGSDAGADDASTPSDAATLDAGLRDAGPGDAGRADDAGRAEDAGLEEDAGAEDAGVEPDSGVETDAGPGDAGPSDAGMICRVGEACGETSPCDDGDRCWTGAAPEDAFCANFAPECGGFVMTDCPPGLFCLRPAGSSIGFCANGADRSCICSRVTARGGSVDGC